MPSSRSTSAQTVHDRPVLVDLWRHRALVVAFAKRDIAGRYRSSALGWLWSLVEPLATLAFFSIVFMALFLIEAPPMGNGGGSSYPAFLFCGLVAWHLFAGLQELSITTLRSCSSLMAKIAFPAWAPVIGAQLVQTLQVLMELVALVVLLVLLGNVGWTWLLAVPIVLGIVLFGMGVGLVVAALSTYFGDVKEIVRAVLTIAYFATPVLYPVSMLEGLHPWAAGIVLVNPMSWYVQAMHAVLYSLTAPSGWLLAGLVVCGAVTFWLGLVVFSRLSRDMVDRL